MGPLSKN